MDTLNANPPEISPKKFSTGTDKAVENQDVPVTFVAELFRKKLLVLGKLGD